MPLTINVNVDVDTVPFTVKYIGALKRMRMGSYAMHHSKASRIANGQPLSLSFQK